MALAGRVRLGGEASRRLPQGLRGRTRRRAVSRAGAATRAGGVVATGAARAYCWPLGASGASSAAEAAPRRRAVAAGLRGRRRRPDHAADSDGAGPRLDEPPIEGADARARGECRARTDEVLAAVVQREAE